MATKAGKTRLRNTSAAPVVLFDGTVLVPGQETPVSADTMDGLRKAQVTANGEDISMLEHLTRFRGIEDAGADKSGANTALPGTGQAGEPAENMDLAQSGVKTNLSLKDQVKELKK